MAELLAKLFRILSMFITSSNTVDTQLVGRVPVTDNCTILTAVDVEAGCEQDDSVDSLSEVVVHLAEAVDHLGCALGVADVSKLGLPGYLKDLVDVGWLVIYSHLSPGEVPPLSLGPRPVPIVDVTVSGAAVVAHPHVVAAIDELQWPGRRSGFVLQAPLGPCQSIHAHAVLDQHRGVNCFKLLNFAIFNFSC